MTNTHTRPRNPAKFSDVIIRAIASRTEFLTAQNVSILDPFAGSGKIGMIKAKYPHIKICCNDLETDWKEDYPIDVWYHQDAEFLVCAEVFDMIITSPTYGNRMADHHNAKDGSKRITYTHRYGRPLKQGNTGVMPFGREYKEKHKRIIQNLSKYLKPTGVFMLNVSNFIKNGHEVDVAGWWLDLMLSAGFKLSEKVLIPTPRMRFGANANRRVKNEVLFIFTKQ